TGPARGGDAVAPKGGLDRLDALRVNRPVIAVAPLDRVPPHPVYVVQQRLAVSRSVVEDGTVRGHRVLDRLPEMPGLRRDWIWEVGARQLAVGDERDLDRRRVADALGQEPDHVVEVRTRAEPAVPPRRVVGTAPHGRAGLSFRFEATVHCGPQRVDPHRYQRVEDIVEGIPERWRE